MAEETNEEILDEPVRKGGIGKFIIPGAILMALIGGIVISKWVIVPMLAGEETDAGEDKQAAFQTDSEYDELPVEFNKIIKLDQNFVNLMRSGDDPAPMLMYGVSLECNDTETFDLVTAHRHRFEDIVMKLHDSHTRDELDDILMFKESIQRKVHQKANDLLVRLQGGDPLENIKITKVVHYQLMVQDPL